MDNEARILLDDVIAFCRRDGRETRLIKPRATATREGIVRHG